MCAQHNSGKWRQGIGGLFHSPDGVLCVVAPMREGDRQRGRQMQDDPCVVAAVRSHEIVTDTCGQYDNDIEQAINADASTTVKGEQLALVPALTAPGNAELQRAQKVQQHCEREIAAAQLEILAQSINSLQAELLGHQPTPPPAGLLPPLRAVEAAKAQSVHNFLTSTLATVEQRINHKLDRLDRLEPDPVISVSADFGASATKAGQHVQTQREPLAEGTHLHDRHAQNMARVVQNYEAYLGCASMVGGRAFVDDGGD